VQLLHNKVAINIQAKVKTSSQWAVPLSWRPLAKANIVAAAAPAMSVCVMTYNPVN